MTAWSCSAGTVLKAASPCSISRTSSPARAEGGSLLLPSLARLAIRVYYRIRYGGEPIPATGPVLLVANHPNSLLDPVVVMASARRQVRFLAKAPLFADPKTAWFVKLGGAIPVHRASDDPTKMADNAAMFRAVHEALGQGDAVGLFPEGISHAAPAMAPLRTGAARIALGAAPLVGGGFPVVPVGLTFRQRDVFRSEARVVIGQPVAWDDLAARGVDDVEAVRELTTRVAEALAAITLNLERWEDEPLVTCAVRVWEAEHQQPPATAERARRITITTRLLAAIRASGDPEGAAVVRAVGQHHRRLIRLGLRPVDLTVTLGWWHGARWAVRRLPVVLPLWAALGVTGWLLFVIPYRLTAWIVNRFTLETDTRSTWQFLIGSGVYLAWVVGWGVVTGFVWNLWAALAVLVAVPVVGMAGLLVRERWRGAWDDLSRFVLMRSRDRLLTTLRQEQHDLAERLDALYHRACAGETA
ncbi:MAG: lysophospholipid acyltransferase family protein [Gemmatimonadales bacterium]|nr:lysophospholipid acyltransferase family protein [Gemmatimonadales bacterium]